MTSAHAPARRRWAALLLCVSLLATGAMAWRMPATRQQELRVLLCGRNMALGGDWLVPEFQEHARLRKPPLAYWMAAVPMRITGITDSPGVARIPFVLCSLATVALLGCWGRGLAGGRAGAVALVLPLAAVGWWRHAALAETDGPLLLCALLTAWFLQRILSDRVGWTPWLWAGLFTGLGLLAKGPAALIPWVAFAAARRLTPAPRPPLPSVRWISALALALVIGLSWHFALWAARDISPWTNSQLSADLPATFTEKTAHRGSWPYYFYTLPKLLLPAGLLLPWVVWKSCRAARDAPGVRFLLAWLGSGFLLLTLLPSKQEHYALQLLPPCLLLAAALPEVNAPDRARRWLFLIPSTATALALAILAGLRLHDLQPLPAFLRECRPRTDAAPLVHVCGVNSALFDFYLGRHVHNVDEPMQAWRRARSGEAVVLAAPAERFAAWQSIPSQPLKVLGAGGIHAELHIKP